MKKINLIIFSILTIFHYSIFLSLNAGVINSITVKVGESLITSIDVQNEILTNLVVSQQEINQENINRNKNFAIKNLINKTMKKNEIKKYQIVNYNKKDLQIYIATVAKKFNTNQAGLKSIFKEKGIDYKTFIERHETELLWNTLIFKIYQNQTNINIVEVDSEIEKIKKNKSEEELKEIKNNLVSQKKKEKLNLFSRSHLSNIENSMVISFNE